MTPVTRQEVLGLYRKIFRIAKKWQSASGQVEETLKEKEYIKKEAKTLFRKNKDVTDPKLIKQCIEECEARIEIGLHYNIPYQDLFICLLWVLPINKAVHFDSRKS
eukprot:XP_005018570.2 LYR motif-containing protein 1 [Anas platyrhynchos]